MTVEFVSRGSGWCDFCQTEHSSSSCYHPGRAKYDALLLLARRLRRALQDECDAEDDFMRTDGCDCNKCVTIRESAWLEE